MATKSIPPDSRHRYELGIYDDRNMASGEHSSGSDRKGAGRPTEIEEPLLLNRRDRLLWLIEEHWAEFAWELRRAKTISQVRDALEPFGKYREFEPFLNRETNAATGLQLKGLRIELETMTAHLLHLNQEERIDRERLEKATNALKSAPVEAHTERLQKLWDGYIQAHATAVRLVRDIEGVLEDTREDLRKKEAHFAQAELLDFVLSKRYTLTPAHLADALAGLPYIAWRRSMQRCARVSPGPTGSVAYQVFLELERALTNPPATASLALAQLKEHLLKRKRQPNLAIQQLCEGFYYVRLSINWVYSENFFVARIPFAVCCNYLLRSSSQTPCDLMLQEDERL